MMVQITLSNKLLFPSSPLHCMDRFAVLASYYNILTYDAMAILLYFLNFRSLRSLVSFTLEKFGKLDFLVNNGGGQFPCGAADMSLKGQSGIINFSKSSVTQKTFVVNCRQTQVGMPWWRQT